MMIFHSRCSTRHVNENLMIALEDVVKKQAPVHLPGINVHLMGTISCFSFHGQGRTR